MKPEIFKVKYMAKGKLFEITVNATNEYDALIKALEMMKPEHRELADGIHAVPYYEY